MQANDTLLDIIRLLLSKRKTILFVTALACCISIAVSLFLPNYYESNVRFKPYNLNAFDRTILFSTGGSDRVINIFGDKADINRILPLTNSPKLQDYIIQKYNLTEHYKINKSDKLAKFFTQREFTENFEVIKTEFDDIEMSVFDQDPEFAAKIANTIIYWIDSVNVSLVKSRNKQILESSQKQLNDKQSQIDSISVELAGIADTSSAKYRLLFKRSESEQKEYLNYKRMVEEYSAIMNNNFSTLYVIEYPEVAVKKSKPVRWIIVVISTLMVAFLTTLYIIVVQKVQEVKSQL